LRQSAALIFCSDVTRLQQNGGVFMHQTTLIVLMVLTLGQIFMLTFGVLILWLAGEFGDAPKLFKGSHSTDRAEKTTVAMRQETAEQSNADGDGLMDLAHEHSIAPRATEDRMDQWEDDIEHSRDRAVSAGK
jgi:hypothetical protein